VGYRTEYLLGAAYRTESFYRQFTVPKKNGSTRTISEPLPSLKEIQRWLLADLLYKVPLSRFAKAFRSDYSIKDNARFHRRQPLVLTMDLQDFFPSIARARVYDMYRRLGYSQPVSNVLARICCYENALPQGAPTSPAISNIVCRRFDQRLGGYARRNNLRYTRYADDLTFSGQFQAGDVIGFVRKVASAEGFTVHPAKIRAMASHQRQAVTGVVVNAHLQAPRSLRRDIRQAIHYIQRHGLDGHLDVIHEKRSHYLEHLLGLVTFILFVNPSDTQARRWDEYLRRLLSGGG
jgi:RNA-directed DNA polymerase